MENYINETCKKLINRIRNEMELKIEGTALYNYGVLMGISIMAAKLNIDIELNETDYIFLLDMQAISTNIIHKANSRNEYE